MIRSYRADDFEVVTKFWHEAQRVAMPELEARMGYMLEDARGYFRRAIAVENQLWVYVLNNIPIGYLGVWDEFIDRLYVDPAYQRRGVGQTLPDHARTLSLKHLWLYTHVANKVARAFYVKNGFIPEKFGVSPPPESEPDVEYHWRSA